jgi:hypothetical protein
MNDSPPAEDEGLIGDAFAEWEFLSVNGDMDLCLFRMMLCRTRRIRPGEKKGNAKGEPYVYDASF